MRPFVYFRWQRTENSTWRKSASYKKFKTWSSATAFSGCLSTRTQYQLVPNQRPGWVLGAGGGRPLPLWGSGGVIPEKFRKTQMLNPAFWWHLLWNFLLFENYGQEVGGGGPIQPKGWGLGDQSPPVPTVVAPMSGSALYCCLKKWWK